jgi:hypothetical protein
MNDMERGKFEEAFKDAFHKAEVGPSENVWTNIELDLEKAQGDKIRRKLFFYKMLAAASIAFAMCVAGIGYYTISTYASTFNNNQIAQKSEESKKSKESEKSQYELSENSLTTKDNKSSQKVPDQSTPRQNKVVPSHSSQSTTGSSEISAGNNTAVIEHQARTEYGNELTINIAEVKNVRETTVNPNDREKELNTFRTLPKLYSPKKPALTFPKVEADPVALMFARLDKLERELAGKTNEKELEKREKLWTSVGFAAGAFNTVNSAVSTSQNNLYASTGTAADKQVKASGIAYSAGISVGTSLSKRWVLQGGINYLTQQSDYTATEAVWTSDLTTFKAASLNEVRAADAQMNSQVVPTAPYNVNNNMQFISVPMQAGYLLINKKVGWQLNAGLSTDLFLQNTINPEGDRLEKTTQGKGEDSPYRSVNFSGLFGTELSYRFGPHYRVALNPGLRYPLSSIYKSDLGIEATPLTFDVGLRFRYIFH